MNTYGSYIAAKRDSNYKRILYNAQRHHGYENKMATGSDMKHGYIPPHERSDKSITPQPLITNETDPSLLNITTRKSVAGDKTQQKLVFNMLEEEDSEPLHPTLIAMFTSLNDNMTDQINRLKRIDISAINTNKSLQFTQDNLKDLKTKVDKLERENVDLKKENDKYHRMTRDINRRIEGIEQKLEQNDHALRRKNILIEGAAESVGENVSDIAVNILSVLRPGITNKDFEFVQRVAKPGGKKPILVVFMSISIRDEILRKKKDLKVNRNMRSIWLNEDANPTIKKQKNE